MEMSRIDNVKPKYDVHVSVMARCLKLDFARLPPPELVEELNSEFKRPGFGLRRGFSGAGMNPFPEPNSESLLDFGVYFPMHYEEKDIAKVVEDICIEHGLITKIEITQGYEIVNNERNFPQNTNLPN
jgi:hypothetical protein